MPKTWNERDERHYDHVKLGDERRHTETHVPNIVHAESSPDASLDQRSKDELLNRAKEIGIRGRSRMTKQALITAIRTA